MATIGDLSGTFQIDIPGSGLLGQGQLSRLLTMSGPNFLSVLPMPLKTVTFADAKFGANFEKPAIAVKGATIDAKTGVNSAITLARAADTPLFGDDDYDAIEIKGDDCWMSFELDTLIDATVSVPLPYGFGVSFEASTAPVFATYKLFPSAQTGVKSLKDGIVETLSEFKILNSAEQVLAIEADTIYTSDIAGTITFGASYTLPLAVNQLTLADATLPLNTNIAVMPKATVEVTGSIALTTEFNIRIRRSGQKLRIGAYKVKGKTYEATLTAAAGVTAEKGDTDLINSFFKAIAPGIDLGGLSPEDFGKIKKVVKDSIDHSLAVSLNAASSSAVTNEAAIIYEIDLSKPDPNLNAALNSVFKGDWTALSHLSNAQKIRNVLIDAVEKKASININLLGLYNYRSLADFVRAMRVVTNLEDGSIVVTDSASATFIASGTKPFAADGKRVRQALYEAFVATATYKALLAGMGATTSLAATQEFLVYQISMNVSDARKNLQAGEMLRVLPVSTLSAVPQDGSVSYARFAGQADYNGEETLRFFFSDITALTPHNEADLKKLGRTVLANLLDRDNPTDAGRIDVLRTDAKWNDLDAHPANVPAPYLPDWYDITMWAAALAKVGPLLADAIRFGKTVQGDPTANPEFEKKRKAVLMALSDATHKTHAAFERAFPVCVMATLSGRTSRVPAPVFEASWGGKTVFSNRPAVASATSS